MNQQISNPRTEERVTEIDLRELFAYYLSRLPILIVAIIIGALLAGMFTMFFITDKFTATSKMYMVSASSDSVVNLQDLNLGTSLSSDYVELMKSRPVIEDVINKLDLDMTYHEALNMISMSVVNDTRIINISVTSTDPQQAMDMANQMARTAKGQLPKVMDSPAPSIVEDAVLPTEKSAPSLKRNTMMGAILCLILVLAILTVKFLLDDTFKTAEDIEKEFGIMPLSVIPEGQIAGVGEKEDVKKHRRRSRKQYNKRKKGAKA